MWRLSVARRRDGSRWLAHHMNGAMLNFIATHDSFIGLGIGSVLPELHRTVPPMLVAAGVITVGIALRIASGRGNRVVFSGDLDRRAMPGGAAKAG